VAAPEAVGKDERHVIRVYLDNNLLPPNAEEHKAETEAFQKIEAGRRAGRWRLEWVVSRRTANELEKTPDLARRAALRAAYDAATLLDDDHTVKGFSSADLHGDKPGARPRVGAAGFVTTPHVADVPDERIFAELRAMGLGAMDAQHLTVVIHNRCDCFLTTDKGILRRRAKIAARYPTIEVMAPSELLMRLSPER